MVIIAALFALPNLPSFISRFFWYFSGEAERFAISGEWGFAAINMLFFSLFAVPLLYRKRASWAGSGMYIAFIISLFVEMYGIPLTLYFTSGLVSHQAAYSTSFVNVGVFGIVLAIDFWMAYGMGMMAIGMLIVMIGWRELYKAAKEGRIAMDGLYGQSRHPQYLGLLFIVWGWFVGWPTLLTIIMAPVLTIVYFRLARMEEKELGEFTGMGKYRSIPMFF